MKYTVEIDLLNTSKKAFQERYDALDRALKKCSAQDVSPLIGAKYILKAIEKQVSKPVIKPKKLCGCQEPCFISGKEWGHFEFVLCKHYVERDSEIGISTLCNKTGELTECYDTEEQYTTLLKKRSMRV